MVREPCAKPNSASFIYRFGISILGVLMATKSFFRDERGQTYSAFKLLIAAVVAVAILGILMTIITGVIGIFTVKPIDATIRVVSDISSKPGTPGKTEIVTFKQGDALVSTSLAEKTTLSADDFCMALGAGNERNKGFDEDEEHGFDLITSPDHRILWKGSQSQSAKVNVVCNSGSLLKEDLGAYGLETPSPCGCFDQTSTCCAIVLEKAG